MKISAHTLVKNEDQFIWFSVMSVIDYVDKYFIWDTGSTDNTLTVIEEIIKIPKYKSKVEIRKINAGSIFEEDKVRQQMLDVDNSDWFLVVDGDEIWWDESIKKVIDLIQKDGKDIESIVVPTINLVGDIYHYQEADAGNYNLAGRRGHLNLRAVNRNIPGLHSIKPHGLWGYVDENETLIQDRNKEKVIFVDAPYLHATHIVRSSSDDNIYKRGMKLKHELGISFPLDFYYPEVFFKSRPETISSPWKVMDFSFKFRSFFETPLRQIKRRILTAKVGY